MPRNEQPGMSDDANATAFARRRLFAGVARVSLRFACVSAACLLLCVLAGRLVRGNLSVSLPRHATEEVERVEAARRVRLDREHPPVVQVEVDYAAGAAVRWRPRGESPLAASLVAEGILPPVAERVGPEPLVMAGPDGVGRYGGSWYRIANNEGDVDIVKWRLSAATLARWSPQGLPVRPHLAKGWSASEDARVWTVHLRRGIRWSDGAPFTADDILFWYERDVRYFKARPSLLYLGPNAGRIEKVDDYTIRFVYEQPNGMFLESMAKEFQIALPKHYLRRYHPEDGDPAWIAAEMARLGIPSPAALYAQRKDWRNPEIPQLWPWIYRTHATRAPFVFVRNPYFWAVDAEGNQLPYLDRIVFDVKDTKVIPIAAANGEVTFQLRNIDYKDHTLLMANGPRRGYEVYHWYPASRSTWTIFPCINRRVHPDRPDTRWKQQLLAAAAFRQALSLAIDRRAIIRAEYNNQAEPAQIDPGPDSPFHHPSLYRSFTEFDPGRAHALLDGLGLTRRDREGMRTFPDGSRMVFYLNVCEFTGPGPAQFVIDDWARVGVRAILRDRSRPLFYAEKAGYEHDFTVWSGESEFLPLIESRNFVPTYNESFWAPAYGIWYRSGGLQGDPLAARTPGAQAPPPDHPLRQCMEWLDAARATPRSEEQRRLVSRILDVAASNVWTISICTPPPQLVVVNKDLRNVPKVALVGAIFATPANAGIETFYFAQGHEDDPRIQADIRRSLTEVVTDTGKTRAVGKTVDVARRNPGAWVGGLVLALLCLGAAAGLALAALRHPFVLRRLALMAPTLLIVSIVVYGVIQLPPSDFLSAKLTELEMIGDEAAKAQIEDKKRLFRYDRSAVENYFWWLGLRWFVTFDPADKGLLQGNLGRSMEDSRLVNDLVGDRIVLTLALTFGTILFTWIAALAIGIYSAARQYTFGDYVFTFLAFIGMCVPNFLLALLLVYAGDKWFGVAVTGLFSPEFAAMKGWTGAKVLDLLQHLWLPVLVLGVGGTASMMRIMRGNLLDELRKPYVTTARAKGLRPFRLLMKYPVRIAMNPFVSGIGALFPQLVSGGAIVSIVLALPTVGPLQLSSLLNQDMYLAGSMLMILSLLSVVGTLVSDLLLLWLDPRIRLEGGQR
jgi:ABC-type dipeptide/oligopeptide/nickel transport system permease component/ABC-type transport system substrate-binding protein